MQNSLRDGRAVDYLVPEEAEISGGDLIVFPAMVAVAATDGLPGQTIACITEGVFELPLAAAATAAIAQGAPLYAEADGLLTPDQNEEAPFLLQAGVTWEACAKGETHAMVKINC